MKKLAAMLLLITLGLSIFAPLGVMASRVAAGPVFPDISGHWAEDVIERFYREDVVSGYPDGTFQPDWNVSRAELARIITGAFGLTEEFAFNYLDVRPDVWYYGYLRFTSRFIPNNQFGGGTAFAGATPAHRSDVFEALVLIKMHLGDLEIDMPTLEEIHVQVREDFNDTEFQVGDINYPNVQRLFTYTWLARSMGIIEGTPERYLHPAWGVTRAELLVMIDRVRG